MHLPCLFLAKVESFLGMDVKETLNMNPPLDDHNLASLTDQIHVQVNY
jgi:hypothetical protein